MPAARDPVFTTATCATSAGLLLNAMPSPIASRIGKPNDQNSASGSRVYSLKRTVTSCQSELAASPVALAVRSFGCAALLITQLPSRQRHENVFERGRVRVEVREAEVLAREE